LVKDRLTIEIRDRRKQMSLDLRQKLKIFHAQLVDRPLDPSNPCYVKHLGTADGAGDPITEIATQIDWSEAASVNLLSGQRGSGKSTELRRLKKELEDNGCVVFLSDMGDYMSLTTTIEITDFLLSIMLGLSEAFEEKYGRNPADRGYGDRLLTFLKTEIKFEEFSIEGGNGVHLGVKASLKEDPDFKKQLQDRLKGHVARVVRQAHAFATEVVEAVRKNEQDSDKKVVFLVDSVEQIRGVGGKAAEVHRSVENLFSMHAESLHLPLLHVVYTIPPYLIPLTPGLGRHLGGNIVYHLPSIHVFNRNGDPDRYGLDIIHHIIGCRFPDWREIFTKVQLDRMALATGGDLRNLFRLIGNTLIKTSGRGVPVADETITEAENHLRREMLPIADDDREWLLKIASTKKSELQSVAELPRLARFFDTSMVLNYRNGDNWYDVHPLLKAHIGSA
jgi:hypothetical protein